MNIGERHAWVLDQVSIEYTGMDNLRRVFIGQRMRKLAFIHRGISTKLIFL